ncbi:hypothetical protein ACP70R_030377 [Stipagrostis hirtigluma subsp. patula]
MAGSRLRHLARLLVGFLPDVQSPAAGRIPLRRKAAYTAVSLAIFLAGSHLLLYGTGIRFSPASAAADLYWMHGAGASNSGTVMALGVIPLLVSEGVVHLLLGRKIVRAVDDDALRNGVQKLLGILLALGLAIGNVLASSIASKLSTTDAILIVLQLFFGGVIVIYLDEVLKKGYGLLTGIPLFTTANVCASIFWKAFSPYIMESCGGLRGDKHWGAAVSSCFHRLIASGDDEPSAIHKAFTLAYLPDVAGMLATCAFFLIVLSLQGFHVTLPLRPRDKPGLQVNYTIRLSYLCFGPLVFQDALVSSLYLIPQLLYTKFGEDNRVVNLLGKWKDSKYYGQAVPVSGIAYYATTPPTLLGERRSVILAQQPDSVPQKRWKRYVAKVAFLVGLCVGALTLAAGLAGVIGSGTGVMLAVTVIYLCIEGKGRDVAAGAFGL